MPKEVPKVSVGSAVVGTPLIAVKGSLMPRDKLASTNKMIPYIQIPIPSLPIDQCQGKRSAPQRLTLQRARLLSPILRMLSSILHWAYLTKHVCKTHKLSANLPQHHVISVDQLSILPSGFLSQRIVILCSFL